MKRTFKNLQEANKKLRPEDFNESIFIKRENKSGNNKKNDTKILQKQMEKNRGLIDDMYNKYNPNGLKSSEENEDNKANKNIYDSNFTFGGGKCSNVMPNLISSTATAKFGVVESNVLKEGEQKEESKKTNPNLLENNAQQSKEEQKKEEQNKIIIQDIEPNEEENVDKKKKKVSFTDKNNEKPLVEIIKVESYKKYNKEEELNQQEEKVDERQNNTILKRANRIEEKEEKFFYNKSWKERSTGSQVGFILSIFPGLGLPLLFNWIYNKCSCNCCATIDKESINKLEDKKENSIGK